MRNMTDGRIQVQVYDVQQYHAAMQANKLPKSRITVCPITDARVLLDDRTRSFRQRDIEKLLLQSERLCSSARHKKIAVLQETALIRESSQQLFGMAGSDIDEMQAKLLLKSIHGRLCNIRRLCIKELALRGDERERWKKNLDRTIADTEAISTASFEIIHSMLTSA